MRYFDCVAVSFYAVYPAQHKSAARVRAFVEFVAEAFRPAKP
jgi:DNA-binding transcriptional LysR family regulator